MSLSPRQLSLSLAVVAVTVASLAFLLAGAGMATVVDSATTLSADDEPDLDEADRAIIEVNVDENGDATWYVNYRYVLDTDSSVEAFENLQTRIEEDTDAYETRFRDNMQTALDSAQAYTGREMSLSDVSVDAQMEPIPQADGQHGVVTYEVGWNGFGAVQDEELGIGDAIHGFYLDPETRLVVVWPEDYELADSPSPQPDVSDPTRLVWDGERHFSADEPDFTLEPASESAGDSPGDESGDGTAPGDSKTEENGDGTDSGDSDAGADGDGTGVHSDEPGEEGAIEEEPGTSDDDLSSGLLALLVVAAVGVVSVGGVVAARRFDLTPDIGLPIGTTTESSVSASEEATLDSDSQDSDTPPTELMTNEERVLAALDDEGGRIKQKSLGERYDWHPSKTSKVVNELKDDGTIDVFRLGRENIVMHPDETLDPTEEDSSTDDDDTAAGTTQRSTTERVRADHRGESDDD